MARTPLLTEGELDALRQFDTCMVANAVETFNVRLHNTGFTNASIHCMFEDAPPMVGYAATARICGTAFWKFLRPESLFWKTWIISRGAEPSWEICMPQSSRL